MRRAALVLVLVLAGCAPAPFKYREVPAPITRPQVLDLDARLCEEKGKVAVLTPSGGVRCDP